VNGGIGGNGSSGGVGGTGGGATGAKNGAGGGGGSGGTAGNAGRIAINSRIGTITLNSVHADGGAGGGTGGTGGNAGNIAGLAGVGGTGGNGGNGGNGGIIGISGTFVPIPLSNVGGAFGQGGIGGTGANGVVAPSGNDGKPGKNGPPPKISMNSDDENEDGAYKTVSFISGAATARGSSGLIGPLEKAATISIPNGTLALQRGDIVFYSRTADGGTSIQCLHSGSKGVTVELPSGGTCRLVAGQQINIHSENAKGSSLPSRNIQITNLPNGDVLEVSEFSIPALMSENLSVRALKNSPVGADRAAYSRLLKNAAAIHVLTFGRTPYRK
jgi:hypothetical protein